MVTDKLAGFFRQSWTTLKRHLPEAALVTALAMTPAQATINTVRLERTAATGETTIAEGRAGRLEQAGTPSDAFTITEHGCLRVTIDGSAPRGETIDFRLIDPVNGAFHDGDDAPVPPLTRPAFTNGTRVCLDDLAADGHRFVPGDEFLVSVRQETTPRTGRSVITESVEYRGIVVPEREQARTKRSPAPKQSPKRSPRPKPTLYFHEARRVSSQRSAYAAYGRESRTESWTDCAHRSRDGTGGAFLAGFEYLGDRARIDLSLRALHTSFSPERDEPPIVLDGDVTQLVLHGDYRLGNGTFALDVPFGGAYTKSRLLIDDLLTPGSPDEVEVGSGPSVYAGVGLAVAPRGFAGPNLRLAYIARADQLRTKIGDAWGPAWEETQSVFRHGPSLGLFVPFGRHRFDVEYTSLSGDVGESFLSAGVLFGVADHWQLGGRVLRWDRDLGTWHSKSKVALLEGRYSW